MSRPPEVTVFAGPSAHGLAPGLRARAGVCWREPARRGDVQSLVDESARPGVVVLCDGVFHVAPAVSHAELCAALDAGWQVWGVSSLGAIRAWELRAEGMRGWGWVHAQFALHEDFTDDEVCLLHFPEPPYFPVSEALVNLRHALAVRGRRHGLPPERQAAVIDAMRQLWFGDRTAQAMHASLVDEGGLTPDDANAFLAAMTKRRVKTADLASLLRARPWSVRGRQGQGQRLPNRE